MVKRVWTDDKIEWLLTHTHLDKQEGYKQFLLDYPNCNVTIRAFCSKRSEIGASHYKTNSLQNSKPLYTERVKKGMVQIKIAQPNVWLQKQKWVWLETHPELYNTVEQYDVFIFLDGDIRNFNPSNIEKISRRELGTMNRLNGFIKGDAEKTRFNLARTRLKLIIYDEGEKRGTVKNYGSGRCSLESKREERKKYYYEHHDKILKYSKEYRKKHPLSEEQKLKQRERAKKWARKKRQSKV